MSHINVGRLGTLEYNSFAFRWRAIRLFNYLSTVPDSPCQPPGFNNSLDHGDCLRWRTPRNGLDGN